MLFIYNKCNLKTPRTQLLMSNASLMLSVTNEDGKNYMFKVADAVDDCVKDKLTERFGNGLTLEGNPVRQFIKLDEQFVGYKSEDGNSYMVAANQIDHKPTPEEREKIFPRNMIVVVTDSDTTVWTHKNNIHPKFPVLRQKIGDLQFVVVVPKWNNWKVLKFPAGILIKNEQTGIEEKIVLTSSTHNRKDHTKYSMNNIEITKWDKKDKIFTFNKSRGNDNNRGGYKRNYN